LLRQGRARGGGRTRRRWRRAEAWRRGRFRDDHLGRFCFAIAAALVGNGSGATDRFAAHVQLPLEPHLRFSQPRPLIARSLAVEPCHDNLFRLPLALHRTLFRRRLVLYGEATLELSQPHRREVTLQQHLPNGTPDPVSREVEGREHRAPLNDADEQTANYGSQDGDPGSVPPHPHPFLLLRVTTETLLRPPVAVVQRG